MPFFSVIIPTYNRKEKLKEAIFSVINQSFSDIEIIVVDDGSQDETRELLVQLAKKYKNLSFYCQEHKGVSAARNLGVKKATADWICFLDSDDLWDKEKLFYQKEYIIENPEICIFQTKEHWIRKGKLVTPPIKHQKKEGDIFLDSLQQCFITPSSVCIKKFFFLQHKGFDEKLLACEDYDLWIRITAQNLVGLVKKKLLTRFEGHSDQLSHLFPAIDRFRIYSLWKNIYIENNFSKEQTQKMLLIFKKKVAIYLQGAKKRKKNTKTLENILFSKEKNQNLLFELKKVLGI